MALVDEYQMQAGNFFHRADGRAIPGVDSYGAACAIFEQGWLGPILCVDIPRAKLVKTCAEANLFFYPDQEAETQAELEYEQWSDTTGERGHDH